MQILHSEIVYEIKQNVMLFLVFFFIWKNCAKDVKFSVQKQIKSKFIIRKAKMTFFKILEILNIQI